VDGTVVHYITFTVFYGFPSVDGLVMMPASQPRGKGPGAGRRGIVRSAQREEKELPEVSPSERRSIEEAGAALASIAGRLPGDSPVGQSIAKISDEFEQLLAAVSPLTEQTA
jgi:hypothetical protein